MRRFIIRYFRDGGWHTYSHYLTGMPYFFANESRADLQAQNLRELCSKRWAHAQAVAVVS